MAYMRGQYYIWNDGERIHFLDDDEGVTLPVEVVEDFCAMFWAQRSREQQVLIRQRAAATYEGNLGADALRHSLGLDTVMDQVRRTSKQPPGADDA